MRLFGIPAVFDYRKMIGILAKKPRRDGGAGLVGELHPFPGQVRIDY